MHNCFCDTMQDMQTWRVFTETVTSRHTVVCLRSRKRDARHTSMLFIGIIKLPNSACCISKTAKLISTKFIYLLLYIYTTLHIKILKEIVSAFLKIFVPENFPIFFTFFFFAQNYKYI